LTVFREIKDALQRAEEVVSSLRRVLDLTSPTTPQNVSAAVNGSFATVTWDDSEGARRISHYAIYRNGALVTTDTNPPYEESGLSNGTHIYQVAAVDAQGVEGAKGTAAEVTVSVVPPNPDVPINFLASAASATGISLTWQRGPIDPAPTDYGLDYATAGASGPWTPIDIALVTSYNHTALTTATQYWYRLAAFNSVTPSNGYATATEITDTSSSVGATNFIIPTTFQGTWDGRVARVPEEGGNPRAVRQGDVIRLAAGTHRDFVMTNIDAGTSAEPVFVRGPTTGQAIIRRLTPQGGGFVWQLGNVNHVRIKGDTTDTGVTAGPDGRRRNIKIMYATNASAGNKDGPASFIKFAETSAGTPYCGVRNITISDVEVDGGWTANRASNGTGIATNTNSQALVHGWVRSSAAGPVTTQGTFQQRIILEYNYLHDLVQEGVYCGPNVYHWSRSGHTPEVPLRYIKARYNYISDTGGDGLLFKSIFDGTPGADGDTENSCHHNVLIRTGTNPSNNNEVGGEGLVTSTAKMNFYNNWIESCGDHAIRWVVSEGADIGDPSGTYTGRIYNNVIIEAGTINPGLSHGILARKETSVPVSHAPTVLSYNNTVINCASNGIFYGSGNTAVNASSWIRNNICLSNVEGQISAGTGSATNNTTTGTLDAVFVDPVGTYEAGNIDLRLEAAIAATGTVGTDIAATDYTDAVRSSPDRGAYEFT
jgi:hypothetical protein